MAVSGAGESVSGGDCRVGNVKLECVVALTADNRGNRILRVGVDDVPDLVIVTEALGVTGLGGDCVTDGGGGGTGSDTGGIGGSDGTGGEGAC